MLHNTAMADHGDALRPALKEYRFLSNFPMEALGLRCRSAVVSPLTRRTAQVGYYGEREVGVVPQVAAVEEAAEVADE